MAKKKIAGADVRPPMPSGIGSDVMPDEDLNWAIGEVARLGNSRNKTAQGVIQALLGILSPVLLRSPDPRAKALGLALKGVQVYLAVKQSKVR